METGVSGTSVCCVSSSPQSCDSVITSPCEKSSNRCFFENLGVADGVTASETLDNCDVNDRLLGRLARLVDDDPVDDIEVRLADCSEPLESVG